MGMSPPLFRVTPDMRAGAEAPSPADMEAAMQAARYSKTAVVKDFRVERYDLSVPEDRERYRKDYLAIYRGFQESRVAVMGSERVSRSEGDPTVVVFLEWIEYGLDTRDHMKEANTNGG
jgi:hypothetical protein